MSTTIGEDDHQQRRLSKCVVTRVVYELYCCMIHNAVHSYRKESVFAPFPSHFNKNEVTNGGEWGMNEQSASDESLIESKDFDRLAQTLDIYMPSVSSLFRNDKRSFVFEFETFEQLHDQVTVLLKDQGVFNDVKRIANDHQTDAKFNDCVALLAFIVRHYSTRPFTLKYITKQSYLKECCNEKDRSFYQEFNMTPDHVIQFSYKNNIFTSEQNERFVCFHGTSSDNLYSILTHSLLNLSNTKLMQHGSAFGDGIYFCDDIRVARSYSKTHHGTHWPQTEILGMHMSAVFQCDVLKDHRDVNTQDRYLIVKNRDCVRIRNILVYSTPVLSSKNTTRKSSLATTTTTVVARRQHLEWIYIVIIGIIVGVLFAAKQRQRFWS